MTKHNIQKFFKDGSYSVIGYIEPSCTYPQGSNFNGTLEISSTYQCEDIKQKFLQKNLKRQTLSGLSLFSFNIYNQFYSMNNNNQALSGKYNIKGKKLYLKLFGYSQPLGKICKQYGVYKLTSTGFEQKIYYLDNHKHYKLFLTVKYTMI